MCLSSWRLLVMSFLPGPQPAVLREPNAAPSRFWGFFLLQDAVWREHWRSILLPRRLCPPGATCWPQYSALRCQLASHVSNRRPATSRSAICYFQTTTTFWGPELAWRWWRDGKDTSELPGPDEDRMTQPHLSLRVNSMMAQTVLHTWLPA